MAFADHATGASLNTQVLHSLFALYLLVFQKQKKRAEGYDEGDYTLFRSAKVSDFLQTEHPLDILSLVNEVC